ncbi:hypothetical protein, partial [Rectinema subterraneum]|uniref:hypothetical protein n=1 Tax=Rectinema subterraneum TaxID=2653714 RepID=UPI001C930136
AGVIAVQARTQFILIFAQRCEIYAYNLNASSDWILLTRNAQGADIFIQEIKNFDKEGENHAKENNASRGFSCFDCNIGSMPDLESRCTPDKDKP